MSRRVSGRSRFLAPASTAATWLLAGALWLWIGAAKAQTQALIENYIDQ
jgi:hypothetical protein